MPQVQLGDPRWKVLVPVGGLMGRVLLRCRRGGAERRQGIQQLLAPLLLDSVAWCFKGQVTPRDGTRSVEWCLSLGLRLECVECMRWFQSCTA